MVKPTEVYDIRQGCCAKTVATVTMINTGCTEYYGGRTVDGSKAKISCSL